MSNEIEIPPELKLLESAIWAKTVHDLLARDTVICLRQWKVHKDLAVEGSLAFDDELDKFQFWFRALVRSFAAQVEGTSYYLRKAAANAYDRGELKALPAELRPVLLEEDPENPKKRRYNGFLANVELGFSWFATAWNKQFTLPKGDHRWQHFKTLVGFRNRITHPKSLEDFAKTADQIIPVEQGMAWFADAFLDLTKVCGVYLSREEKERRERQRRESLPESLRLIYDGLDRISASSKEAWRGRQDPELVEDRKSAITSELESMARKLGLSVPSGLDDEGAD